MGLHEAAGIVAGVCQDADREFCGVGIDTRKLRPRDLFVALGGAHSDGHEFIHDAEAQGAAGALVSRAVRSKLAQIRVDDTTRALAQLASDWRRRFAIPVLGVTGSNGKTTVTAMLARILQSSGHCLSPEGSFNNQWGVPLTLLKLSRAHTHAVIEMGMNHAGEIAALGKIAAPTFALINNAAPAHLESLGDVAGVAKAKGEIIDALGDDGCIVLNADDAFFAEWRQRAGRRRIVTFGFAQDADARADAMQLHADAVSFNLHWRGEVMPIKVALPGKHNVMNALASAAACLAMDIPRAQIQTGLAAVRAVSARLNLHSLGRATLIDDSYNANPASLEAAIEVLAQRGGRRVLALGAMAELGELSGARHYACGELAKSRGVDALYAFADATDSDAREYARGFGAPQHFFTEIDALRAALAKEAQSGACILVKGSRASRMERIVQALQSQQTSETDAC